MARWTLLLVVCLLSLICRQASAQTIAANTCGQTFADILPRKVCLGNTGDDYVTSGNIDGFEGCTEIQGAIRILQTTLDGDPARNITRMGVDKLMALESVRDVTDYLQVELDDPTFDSLRFLRNLRLIQGRRTTHYGAAVEIYETSLKTLDLDSLKKIRNGHVIVRNNKFLCYANYINWRQLFRPTGRNRYSVAHNRNRSLCRQEGAVCSDGCSSDGCWGPADTQCLSCAFFSLEGERCLSSCDSVRDIYQSTDSTCSRCHSECDGCTNATAAWCKRCRNVRNGSYCVPECPRSKYPDDNRICQECYENCAEPGSTDPFNSVGSGTRNARVLYQYVVLPATLYMLYLLLFVRG